MLLILSCNVLSGYFTQFDVNSHCFNFDIIRDTAPLSSIYPVGVASPVYRVTVDSLLTDTSIRRTPLYNGHLELVPAFLYSLYLTLYKTDTSLRRTLSAGPKGVRLRDS